MKGFFNDLMFYELVYKKFKNIKEIFFWIWFIIVVFSLIYEYFFHSSYEFTRYLSPIFIIALLLDFSYHWYLRRVFEMRIVGSKTKITIKPLIVMSLIFPSQFGGVLYGVDDGKTFCDLIEKDKSGFIARRFFLCYWFLMNTHSKTTLYGNGVPVSQRVVSNGLNLPSNILLKFYKCGNEQVRGVILKDPNFSASAELVLNAIDEI